MMAITDLLELYARFVALLAGGRALAVRGCCRSTLVKVAHTHDLQNVVEI